MSLGEDPSVEHGILVAEDLRCCPNNDHVKCGTHRRVGIQMRQKREGQCSLLVHRMKWLRSPGSSGTTRTRRSARKHADSAGTRRVSQSQAKGNQQFPQTRSSGGSYEIWIAMQKFDADALGYHEET